MVRFQQLSAPTAAKSVEDTAFYRYGRLLSRNEVGSEPSQFAMPPAAFHASAPDRRRRFPRALLATATHDHKRGEDTRARLAVLSEMPGEWEAARRPLDAAERAAASARSTAAGAGRRRRMMLYQTLVGAWPLDLAPDDRDGRGGVPRPGRRLAGEGAARGQAALATGRRRTRPTSRPAADFLAQCLDPARPAPVAREIARVRRPHRAGRARSTAWRRRCCG